ncbi:phosphoribosyltransferase [Microbacterium sp. 179-B 1A2 NHS]|uniref:phosphoribosyltransferase n=1 Tax=Microbacterium sp. 179-B 1A2 NHS TaxID=3142383 RepID=UPI0039A37F7C
MFAHRPDAGRRLGRHLAERGVVAAMVFGLPRGGVPVAAEVARVLRLPLDVIVVRKLGLPAAPEVAMGAIAEGGIRVVDDDLIRRAGVTPAALRDVERRERDELERRAAAVRAHRPARPDLGGRTVLVVDDGIATGATASAACRYARDEGAARVIVAAPIGPRDAACLIVAADEVICLAQPRSFRAVGEWYEDFAPTSDAEVVRLLAGTVG